MADITAKINAPTSSGPQKVSVTLPSGSAQQNSSLSLKLLGDVEMTGAGDGALLQLMENLWLETKLVQQQVH